MAQENNTAREQTALEKLSQDALNCGTGTVRYRDSRGIGKTGAGGDCKSPAGEREPVVGTQNRILHRR